MVQDEAMNAFLEQIREWAHSQLDKYGDTITEITIHNGVMAIAKLEIPKKIPYEDITRSFS